MQSWKRRLQNKAGTALQILGGGSAPLFQYAEARREESVGRGEFCWRAPSTARSLVVFSLGISWDCFLRFIRFCLLSVRLRAVCRPPTPRRKPCRPPAVRNFRPSSNCVDRHADSPPLSTACTHSPLRAPCWRPPPSQTRCTLDRRLVRRSWSSAFLSAFSLPSNALVDPFFLTGRLSGSPRKRTSAECVSRSDYRKDTF